MKKNIIRVAALLGLMLTTLSAWSANEVQLISAKSHNCPSAPCSPTAEVLIEVQNIAPSKEVGVHYRTASGVWSSVLAIPFTTWPAAAGKSLWFAQIPEGSDSFAVYYMVNGIRYWDNNGGQNYHLSANNDDALLIKSVIGSATGWRVRFPQDAVQGQILVKNLSYTKQVKVVYTDNNWATTKEAFATYKMTYPSGIEAWSFSAPLTTNAMAGQIQIAFYYQWSGGSAWDNNYGHNYVINSQNFISTN